MPTHKSKTTYRRSEHPLKPHTDTGLKRMFFFSEAVIAIAITRRTN